MQMGHLSMLVVNFVVYLEHIEPEEGPINEIGPKIEIDALPLNCSAKKVVKAIPTDSTENGIEDMDVDDAKGVDKGGSDAKIEVVGVETVPDVQDVETEVAGVNKTWCIRCKKLKLELKPNLIMVQMMMKLKNMMRMLTFLIILKVTQNMYMSLQKMMDNQVTQVMIVTTLKNFSLFPTVMMNGTPILKSCILNTILEVVLDKCIWRLGWSLILLKCFLKL